MNTATQVEMALSVVIDPQATDRQHELAARAIKLPEWLALAASGHLQRHRTKINASDIPIWHMDEQVEFPAEVPDIRSIKLPPIGSKSAVEAFQSTDPSRYILNGTYHDAERKCRVATDGFTLIRVDDPSVTTSKVVNRRGEEIQGGYPPWWHVIPNHLGPAFINIGTLDLSDKALARMVAAQSINRLHVPRKDEGTPREKYARQMASCLFTAPDKSTVCINPDFIIRMIVAFRAHGAGEAQVYIGATDAGVSPVVFESAVGVLTMAMPIRRSGVGTITVTDPLATRRKHIRVINRTFK